MKIDEVETLMKLYGSGELEVINLTIPKSTQLKPNPHMRFKFKEDNYKIGRWNGEPAVIIGHSNIPARLIYTVHGKIPETTLRKALG